ncbi:transposase [Spirosoma sp. HMF4905]|uniref:Transposase n=1 Tax=Spirosoma arboris TaxID=2682092 RepID=A0A7K1S7V8_9BACT|nr:transposase [Spirosoma arboris]
MKANRFSEAQIVAILKQQQNGYTVVQIAREHGISEATFYNWRQKYGCMEASELKRLKDFEDENRRLKKMYAELSLDHEVIKEALKKRGRACSTSSVGSVD